MYVWMCGCVHLVIPRSPSDALELFRVDGHGVLAVLLQHGERLLVVYLPLPVRVAWDPDFGEGDELCAGGTGFVDEVDGLADAAFEVEPCGLGGDLCFWSVWRERSGKDGCAYGSGFVLCEHHVEGLEVLMEV